MTARPEGNGNTIRVTLSPQRASVCRHCKRHQPEAARCRFCGRALAPGAEGAPKPARPAWRRSTLIKGLFLVIAGGTLLSLYVIGAGVWSAAMPKPTPRAAAVAATPRPTAGAGGAAATLPPRGARVVRTEGTALREGPGIDYPFSQTLAPGEPVTLLERNEEGTWYHVRSESGGRGWVPSYSLELGELALSVPTVARPTTTPGPSATATASRSPTASATPCPTPTPGAVVVSGGANVRAGPGTHYDNIGVVLEGVAVALLGRDADASWYVVRLPNGQTGWVGSSRLELGPSAEYVPLAATIPPSPTPAPTAVPTEPPPTLAPTPPPSSPCAYVASVNSDVFHHAWCSYVDRIKSYNRICFATREQALASGRRPCMRCSP